MFPHTRTHKVRPHGRYIVPYSTMNQFHMRFRVIDNVLYVLSEANMISNLTGGTNFAYSPKNLQVLKYDEAARTFIQLATLGGTDSQRMSNGNVVTGTARAFDLVKHATNGKLYLIGSFSTLENSQTESVIQTLRCNNVAAYIPATNSWETVGSGVRMYDSLAAACLLYDSATSSIVLVGQFDRTGDDAQPLLNVGRCTPANLTTITGNFFVSGMPQSAITLGRKGETVSLTWSTEGFWIVNKQSQY